MTRCARDGVACSVYRRALHGRARAQRLQHLVHAVPGRLEVGADGGIRPPFRVQIDNGSGVFGRGRTI